LLARFEFACLKSGPAAIKASNGLIWEIYMDAADVFAKLKVLIADFFGADTDLLTPESSAADVDGWDSIGHTMLILEIERAFNVRLTDQAASHVSNVGELADLVARSAH
jgi:acyl carrier protein